MGSGSKRPPAAAVEEEGHVSDGGSMKKQRFLPTSIRNKEKRAAVHAELKRAKKVEKRKKAKLRDAAEKKALELGEAPPPRKVPRTIENAREADETVCMPDDEELFAGNDADEFSSILKKECTPKVLITTCRLNSTRGPAFISDLLVVIPNAHYFKRGTYELKKIVEYASSKDFASLIVVHTNRREPGHKPELVMNNFTTRLGHRIGRLMQSLFPQDPNFRGRRVVTFHNQRDFIFFRHHRYIFEDKEIKKGDSSDKTAKGAKNKNLPQQKVIARLQECGPRFTLKLISLQHGTFDTKGGEFVRRIWTLVAEDFSCHPPTHRLPSFLFSTKIAKLRMGIGDKNLKSSVLVWRLNDGLTFNGFQEEGIRDYIFYALAQFHLSIIFYVQIYCTIILWYVTNL